MAPVFTDMGYSADDSPLPPLELVSRLAINFKDIQDIYSIPNTY